MARDKFDWYEADVLLLVEQATDAGLAAVAFQVEGQAKVNIRDNGQVDTGFMLNATYAITKGGETPVVQDGTYPDRAGTMVERKVAGPPPALAEGASAAVYSAAEYAIYQEMGNSFLYRAAEQVAPQAGATIEAQARKVLGDSNEP